MNKKPIDLNDAKQSFVELMRSLDATDQQKFLTFIMKEWKLKPFMAYNDSGDDTCNSKKLMDESMSILNSIVSDIKQKIPFNAILSSENFITPLTGENSDCDPSVTLHMDEFLYNDEDIDKLIESNQLERYYCTDCRSRNIQPLIFLSHSMSQDGLYFIFKVLLPTLENKTVLDVGSRLGAVLYGAYVYTDARRIIGVEMNREFCNLQNETVCKYKMDNRISILHKRIEEVPEIIKQSDVIIINNAFEFYLPRDVQIDIWKCLRTAIKPGTLLVTRPSVETTFKILLIGISVEKWLKPFKKPDFNQFSFLLDYEDKFSEIWCYEVL
ncbi:hypothetical protein ALC60_07256 [Trachymyrmex zeteki]|uniref:Methyltransferase type 11 domain-containing protein n=1 Tax=Mycetomoellerius zeteki TaxID=64791 RepID=A0A151X088_9HYME|nr:PREDICTED: uncharacterized protein LOC108724190 [Trachymyrmex zeteki]KYQ53773.1 hypothetical protein ALC60_07256 [Trachymyrmex zeteki]